MTPDHLTAKWNLIQLNVCKWKKVIFSYAETKTNLFCKSALSGHIFDFWRFCRWSGGCLATVMSLVTRIILRVLPQTIQISTASLVYPAITNVTSPPTVITKPPLQMTMWDVVACVISEVQLWAEYSVFLAIVLLVLDNQGSSLIYIFTMA